MSSNAELHAYLEQQGLVYRLAELVTQAAARIGSAFKLATVINQHCISKAIPGRVSAHVLEKLVEFPATAGINLKHLLALNAYFAQDGRGFDQIPILRRKRLVDALRGETQVSILIAAKPTHPNQTHYTRWDSRALAAVRRHVLNAGEPEDPDEEPGSRVNALDVVLGPERAGRRYANEDWHQLIEDDRTSLVSIGSPRASLASELMLARMLQVQPHGLETPALYDARLPFQFVWPNDRNAFPVGSTFALSPNHVRSDSRALARRIAAGDAAALACNHQLLIAPASSSQAWNTFGVICVQRRSRDHLWVVLAGLSGPATLAAARLLPEFQPAPDHPRMPSTPSPVHWAIVTARITEGPGSPGEGDNRILNGSSLGKTHRHL